MLGKKEKWMRDLNLQQVWDEFVKDESGGERDTLTTLLILALIILPLVALIIVFGTQIKDKAKQVWDAVFGTTV